MKEFIRFLITLIVLMLVAGTIYYAVVIHGNQNVINEIKKDENNTSFDEILNRNDSLEIDNDDSIKENLNSSSNQDVIVKFERKYYTTMNMGEELLGNSIKDFLIAFEANEIPVMFQKVMNNDGTQITIIPMSDFIDTQEFVYDANGMLLSYTKISKTVGGNVKYIFSNNMLMQTINNMEESIVPVYEVQDEILARANRLYNL